MSCQKSLTINAAAATTELPIDNAILATSTVAGGEFIWGVRGPYVFKINSTTGALISTAKVDNEMFGPTCIAYDTSADRLKIAGWNKPFPGITDDEAGPNAFNTYFRLYTVNPNTLLVDSSILLNTNLGLPNGDFCTQMGVVSMKWIGAGAQQGLWGIYRTNQYSSLFRYVAGTVYTRKYALSGCTGEICNDIAWDGIDSLYWSQSFFEDVQLYSMSSNGAFWNYSDSFNLWSGDSSIPFGIEVSPSTGDIYVGTQLGLIKRLNYSGGFTLVNTLNTGIVGTIYKVRYNPYDGMLYCPIFGQDSIAVVDPSTNTLNGAVHTGYASPWDLVFSATKTWVIQGGNEGVKLFT